MKVLKIKDIEGLYNEMFFPSPKNFFDTKLKIEDGFLDANTYFWSQFFRKDKIINILSHLEENIHNEKYKNPKFLAIANNKEKFISLAIEAPIKICDTNISPKDFFSCLETMEILCKLYSEFSFPFIPITIQNSYELDITSSKKIYNECINPKTNPYYFFVKKHVLSLIEKYLPDLIILEGNISYYTMCIATLCKNIFPKIHISISKHSTEYFSLNKITKYLVNNKILFNMIDSIILECFDETEKILINTLEHNNPLKNVPNLLFKSKDNQIVETMFEPLAQKSKIIIKSNIIVNQEKNVSNIHFSPYTKCSWNKCTFCGINKKYHFENVEEDERVIVEKVLKLVKLSNKTPFIWITDEELTTSKMRLIAKSIIENKCKIFWEARCRADISLLQNDLPYILSQSGLKELRIGLESASYLTLKLMNKFDSRFNLNLMEEIICKYTEQNISIHCPIIIGFPGETDTERQKTYDFLSAMKERYPLFSFNINILDLDVSSKLFKEWECFNIAKIMFPCEPALFLGNSIAWITQNDLDKLIQEREKFTLDELYPWMPRNTFIKPSVFYRLSETSRNTLRWKSNQSNDKPIYFATDISLVLSPDLSIVRSNDLFLIYNLRTHHFMYGNNYLIEIIKNFKFPSKVSLVIKKLNEKNKEVYHKNDVLKIIKKMFIDEYLLGSYILEKVESHLDIKKAYNKIYTNRDGVYDTNTDTTLLENSEYIADGPILEIGVGLGKNIDYFLSKKQFIDAIDISDVAINYLKNKYNSLYCNFINGDICNTNIKKNKYSLIICSMVLSYLNDIELINVVEKIKDGLKINGCIYILDLSRDDPLNSMNETNVADKRHFRTIDEILYLFEDFEIIETKKVFRKSFKRLIADSYFGTISFFGRKKA